MGRVSLITSIEGPGGIGITGIEGVLSSADEKGCIPGIHEDWKPRGKWGRIRSPCWPARGAYTVIDGV